MTPVTQLSADLIDCVKRGVLAGATPLAMAGYPSIDTLWLAAMIVRVCASRNTTDAAVVLEEVGRLVKQLSFNDAFGVRT